MKESTARWNKCGKQQKGISPQKHLCGIRTPTKLRSPEWLLKISGDIFFNFTRGIGVFNKYRNLPISKICILKYFAFFLCVVVIRKTCIEHKIYINCSFHYICIPITHIKQLYYDKLLHWLAQLPTIDALLKSYHTCIAVPDQRISGICNWFGHHALVSTKKSCHWSTKAALNLLVTLEKNYSNSF